MTRVLIANRGEIALRVIRAAHDLGLEAVAVYSSADAAAPHVREADDAVEIGPAPAQKSYLSIPALIEAAAGCEIVHPGYGFLSERAEFAAAVEEAGLAFAGPSSEHIALMGDKARAREAAADAGVPTIPGSDGAVADVDEAAKVAGEAGYPVALKAAGGGGGRGIRIAHDEEELRKQYGGASSEADKAFGDKRIYVERFVHPARHVEVQVLGDGSRAVHLYERECSLQRRRSSRRRRRPGSRTRRGRGCARRPCGCATRSATAARARPSSSSTTRRASSSSSR
jgi:acetyl-CoA carboxylase biotin carboxylase subunit